ncbi:unnamed protein product [Ectocarpus sp. CCAP 1310/34]|nr:unnamed protein product [Ectocarpus sp. CCAP 1310/34]
MATVTVTLGGRGATNGSTTKSDTMAVSHPSSRCRLWDTSSSRRRRLSRRRRRKLTFGIFAITTAGVQRYSEETAHLYHKVCPYCVPCVVSATRRLGCMRCVLLCCCAAALLRSRGVSARI